MRDKAYRFRLSLVLALVGILGVAFTVRAAEAAQPTDPEVLALFQKGIEHYESEELGEARDAFEQILAMKPSSRVALEMRNKAEIGLFVRMQTQEEDQEFAEAAGNLLQMMTAAARHEKREIADVQTLLANYRSVELRTHLEARERLIGHGQYAVPYLLEFLTTQGPENQSTVARAIATLTAMDRDACVPLITALATKDDVLKTRVAGVLGQLGDARAVPSLVALLEDPAAPQPVAETAGDALKNITGQDPGQLSPALEQYKDVITKYLGEDTTSVGYIFGEWAPIWRWNAAGEQLHERLTYELVPRHLYYQRAGAELALEALKLTPEDADLKSLLVALLSRQVKSVRFAAEGWFGEEVQADAEKRLADLEERQSVIGHLCDSDVVGQALKRVLALRDAEAALILVKLLGGKAGAESGEGAEALLAALEALDKDVRYHASIQIVKRSPSGNMGEAVKVMEILSAALKYAAGKNALLVFNDFQLRNRLSAVVHDHEFRTTECVATTGSISEYLNLQPGVDIVFLTGDLSEELFGEVMEKLKTDARTKAVPLYVVIDAERSTVDLSQYEGIRGVLSPLEVRAAKLAPLFEDAVSQRVTPAAAERGSVVLLAAHALQGVDPTTTQYPLAMLEPALVAALRGYDEPVQMAAVQNLAGFGSAQALARLAELAADEAVSDELKASACHAIAAVAKRTGEKLPPNIVEVLKGALKSDVQTVKDAAAEALGVSGLASDDLEDVLEGYARPTPVATPAQ